MPFQVRLSQDVAVETDPLGWHKQTIVKGKVCISTSPNSEFIVDVNVKRPGPGFTKILLNVTEELLPKVVLLPSGTVCPIIFIPLQHLKL